MRPVSVTTADPSHDTFVFWLAGHAVRSLRQNTKIDFYASYHTKLLDLQPKSRFECSASSGCLDLGPAVKQACEGDSVQLQYSGSLGNASPLASYRRDPAAMYACN